MEYKDYYQITKKYRKPQTEDEYEYIIRKLYRQLKKAYTVDEARAIIEEIYNVKAEMAERILNKWHSSV